MSASNPFASFAEETESKPIVYETKHEQLTVDELLNFLQTLVRKNPDAKNATISHVEFGAIHESTTVETMDGRVVISGGY